MTIFLTVLAWICFFGFGFLLTKCLVTLFTKSRLIGGDTTDWWVTVFLWAFGWSIWYLFIH